ncbi:F-ATPase gamma subunit [Thiorhodovibrio winogradskyi]|uniref:F-ATPase gamma subunit n=1 Tax=Thiorhodovibrio winogradskyi TaxID=77007 RepID=A0ABZ0SCZ7_9GAMM|nr:F0F1 ATP synthase subunit gamma [Thiorhodovibrio winogradskyi]
MSDTTANLRHKIASAGDLQAVVRTMKSLAASSINQYEQSVRALGDYARTVELGLSICFRAIDPVSAANGAGQGADAGVIGAIVFGSDQGLVGQFNDRVADHAVKTLAGLTHQVQDAARRQPRVWAVGERVQARLADAGLAPTGHFAVPSAVAAITALVGEILVATEAHQRQSEFSVLYLFYNRPSSAAVYAPVDQRLLPLDDSWRRSLTDAPWPTNNLPEVIVGDTEANRGANRGADTATLRALIREHLFVSLFRACAESLASENASRLAAMQRADKNIEELLETLNATFHQRRQSAIDAELFDVIAGFEALAKPRRSAQRR